MKNYIFNTTDTELVKYNGTEVEVVRPLTDKECDVEDVGNMYRVRFYDGYECDAFEDELTAMRVKVLNFLDYDYGNIMDTFVFTEEADIEEIKKTVRAVFADEEGSRPYCEIISELYGHLMLNVIEREEVDW